MLANIVPKYLRSTNALPTQKATIPLVNPKNVAKATWRIVKKEMMKPLMLNKQWAKNLTRSL
jgi:hypothetical protein